MDLFVSMNMFRKVVDTGTFAEAGRRTGVSRSAVSKHINRLEERLGVQLLQRSTRKMAPTEIGRIFYDRSVQALETTEEAMNLVGEMNDRPSGTLRVNGPMTFGTLHLAGVAAEFAHKHPDVRLELVLNDRRIDPIAEGFDITVRISAPEHQTSLVTHEIGPIQLALCASPDYLERHGEPETPAELAKARCVHYGYQGTGNQWRLRSPDGEVHVPVNCAMWSNNGEVLREGALSGLGVALLPTFIVGKALSAGTLKRVMHEYTPAPLSLFALYPRHRYVSPKVRRLVELMEHHFGGEPKWDH